MIYLSCTIHLFTIASKFFLMYYLLFEFFLLFFPEKTVFKNNKLPLFAPLLTLVALLH